MSTLRLPDGRQVQFWDTGTGRSVVFFFHGCPDTRHAAFPGAATARAYGVRLVAVNRPGYGESDATASDHLSVADDVAAVADQLEIDRYAVLGMSIGGPYALACAARHPDRVTRAAVVASPALVPALDPPYHRDDLAPEQQEFFTGLAQAEVDESVERIRPDFTAYVEQLDPADPDDDALAARWTTGHPPLDAEWFAGQSAADLAAAAREALANPAGYLRDAAISFRDWGFRPEDVTCPTTVWHGVADPQVSIRNARWLAEHLPDAQLELRSSAHLSTLHNHWAELLTALR
ncbi:alpha/beta hydrolase [Kribbella sp. NPDC051770]|uniref:alpha/beta hydrolase n=1 Tax=Kribbella sp. NPDC051770 TaxID=3155413 RepID=UPI003413B407